jgi:CDP-6-deoxy-D-xylo-4-hexulose-3-dehydrase
MIGIDSKTWGIDLEKLEDFCRKNRNGSCVFVQVLGVPHDLEINHLREKYNLLLFEDSCAAQGAFYIDDELKRKNVGCIGDMSSFSFYFGHQMSTIEGGMVSTDDYELYQYCLMLRSHGWHKDIDEKFKSIYIDGLNELHSFNFIVPGFNLRSTDLNAFIGIEQLKKIPERSFVRTENHYRYAKNLNSSFEIQDWGRNVPSSIHFGVVFDSTVDRNEKYHLLKNNGVETRIFNAGNLGRHPFWVNKYGLFEDEQSDRLYESGLFLPNNHQMSSVDIDVVCGLVNG